MSVFYTGLSSMQVTHYFRWKLPYRLKLCKVTISFTYLQKKCKKNVVTSLKIRIKRTKGKDDSCFSPVCLPHPLSIAWPALFCLAPLLAHHRLPFPPQPRFMPMKSLFPTLLLTTKSLFPTPAFIHKATTEAPSTTDTNSLHKMPAHPCLPTPSLFPSATSSPSTPIPITEKRLFV